MLNVEEADRIVSSIAYGGRLETAGEAKACPRKYIQDFGMDVDDMRMDTSPKV